MTAAPAQQPRGRVRPLRSRLVELLPEPVRHRYRIWRHGLRYVRRATDGMLPLAVYERLYHEVVALPDADILEIGAAAGTASITIAWAMRDSQKRSKLVIAEKCQGGSRDRYGTREQNLARLEHNLRRFGVADRIRLFPHHVTFENAGQLLALCESEYLAALVLDADGRIHRDFHAFWPRLCEQALIVVDDYHPSASRKHERTWRLLNCMIEWGLIEPIEVVGDTYFGRKPSGATMDRFDLEHCRRIVEEVGV